MYYSQMLPKSPAAAGLARRLLEQVRSDISESAYEDARLLVSELVSNVIDHVREAGEIEVRVQTSDGTLRVEVLDPGPGFTPPPPDPNPRKESGWGLLFIDLLAKRWAADSDGRARVWFELDRLSVR